MLQIFSDPPKQIPFMLDLGKIRRVRRGSKTSRFFKLIFEHKSLNKLFGANLALALFASSFFPLEGFGGVEEEQNIIQEEGVLFTTIKVVQYPLDKMSVSQGFSRFHPGVDLAAPYGEPVRSIKPGVVEEASFSSLGYGRMVFINHDGGIASLYAHLSKIFVDSGQEVTSDTVIGKVGATGHASGSHLHLEIRKQGVAVNPFSILPLLLASR